MIEAGLASLSLCSEGECSEFQGQDYQLYLTREKCKLVVAHTIMFVLCSISKKEWNYLERRIQPRIVGFSGKRRLLQVVKAHLLRNLTVWPEIERLVVDDAVFGVLAHAALSELGEAGFITSRLEHRCYRRKHYDTLVYSTTMLGLQYFEKWIYPLLKQLPPPQGPTGHSTEEGPSRSTEVVLCPLSWGERTRGTD